MVYLLKFHNLTAGSRGGQYFNRSECLELTQVIPMTSAVDMWTFPSIPSSYLGLDGRDSDVEEGDTLLSQQSLSHQFCFSLNLCTLRWARGERL